MYTRKMELILNTSTMYHKIVLIISVLCLCSIIYADVFKCCYFCKGCLQLKIPNKSKKIHITFRLCISEPISSFPLPQEQSFIAIFYSSQIQLALLPTASTSHDCPLQHYWEHNSTKCCNQNRCWTMGMNELDLMQ